MLLAVDVGNSQTVLGLYEGDTLRAHWRVVTAAHRTADELRIVLHALLQQEGVDPGAVSNCCVSSVVPPLDREIMQALEASFGVAPLFVGPGVRTGLVIQVDNPREVGADRIVNAVGALTRFGGPLVVIDFGTATTFDVVTARAEYRGGVILPGLQIAADALCEKCAKLPRVDIVQPPSVIGRDTVTNIQAGLTYGYAAMVDGLVARMEAELAAAGSPTPTVVATGGLAPLIADIATRVAHVDPWLTLTGLKAVHDRNRNAGA